MWLALEASDDLAAPYDHVLNAYHFHLVGNGEMVHFVRKALRRAGLAPERVSIETYFNHHAEPPEPEVEALAARIRHEDRML